jgi:NitT/TauT family transport system substrate-binding protein
VTLWRHSTAPAGCRAAWSPLRWLAGAALALAVGCSGPASSPAPTSGDEPARAGASVAAPAATAPAATASPPLTTIHVLHNAVAGSQALINVIAEAGLFARHGLAVDVANASPRATTAALLAGEVPLTVASGVHVVGAGLAGGDTVMAAGGIDTLDTSIWTREPMEPGRLAGRRIAVSTFGDAADFAVRYAARRWGLDPGRDLQILQVGQPGERLAHLEAAAVDATIIQPPLTTVARKAGFYKLADIADLGLDYQHTGVVTTRARVAAEPDVIARFVGAWSEDVYYYRAHRPEARAAVGHFMQLDDADALDETYERYTTLYARPPYPTLRGLQTILDELAAAGDARAPTARPEDFVDTRFLDQLQAAGQFQQWEQQYPAAR